MPAHRVAAAWEKKVRTVGGDWPCLDVDAQSGAVYWYSVMVNV